MLVDFTGQQSSLSHQTASSVSVLSLSSVLAGDSGNYTCQPAGLTKVGHLGGKFPNFFTSNTFHAPEVI